MGPAASTPIAKAIVISSASASMRWATSRLKASLRRAIGTRMYGSRGESGWIRLSGVGAFRVELFADQPELLAARGLGLPDVVGHLEVPARALPDLLQRHTGMQALERHLAGLVEPVDPQAGDHHGRTLSLPLLRTVAAQVTRTRDEVDRVDERALRLRHDDEDLLRVDRDLARAARARQPHLGLRVVADRRGVEVAVAVDLRAAQEADVDVAAFQEVRE